jgi:hypothetical protein
MQNETTELSPKSKPVLVRVLTPLCWTLWGILFLVALYGLVSVSTEQTSSPEARRGLGIFATLFLMALLAVAAVLLNVAARKQSPAGLITMTLVLAYPLVSLVAHPAIQAYKRRSFEGAEARVGDSSGSVDRAAAPVTIDVRFTLTDLDSRPLAGQSVRLIVGLEPGWQNPDAGKRFVTDANGEYRFSTQAVLDQRLRKMPTNFVSSLVSRRQRTDHLSVAAELGFMTFRWLYTVDVYRFPDGTSALLDGLSVYTPDSGGQFTTRATHDESGWRIADLGGMVLTTPGYQPAHVTLLPDESDLTHQRWRLHVAFQRQPPPMRR